MKTPHLKIKAITIAGFFSIIVTVVAFYIDSTYEKLSEDVINTHTELCEVLASNLKTESQPTIDSLHKVHYFAGGYGKNIEYKTTDKILSEISKRAFSKFNGFEGGFYVKGLEEFQGYSYPTSPPPIPVYGPPPRSYNFIKGQILQSINRDTLLIQLHQFDPAVFPLVTIPIKSDNEIVGAIWVRTHIEKELLKLTMVDILNITAIVSLLGFILAVTISIRLSSRVESIRSDLEKLEYDYNHRVKALPGIFGFISKSINKMIDAFQIEQLKREKLENELHQKDKMASLGKLIAGVAHEVKTPLAIIKTRIQMWQKKLYDLRTSDSEECISNESMQLVINEINRLSNLVSRLLIFSKPVSEQFKVTNINKLIEDLVNLFENKFASNKIKVELKLDGSVPEIKVDPDKIEQVIINLITNSIESVSENGEIAVETSVVNDDVLIKISDNGTGMPLQIQKNVLDPFFTTKEKGTGLGLSIAYEIMKAHKGKITFTSNESSGSVFNLFIPINDSK